LLSSYCEEILNNNNDINIECWCDVDYYLFALTAAEFSYNKLIQRGWKPQQAREVLPLATKSQLIHTAFIDDWKHFFALRADGISGPVHPNAKLVAEPLKQEFIKHNLL
jgi:thymidylate synthase (FAD)